MKLYVGTSGFAYKEWRGRFYPEGISSKEMLSFYSKRLNAVEINNTFYRMPNPSIVEGWAAQVSEDFQFALKAPRRITHFKRLKNAQQDVEYFVSTVSTLGARLGPVLYQLPGNFPCDLQVLQAFLNFLSGTRAAFEFRHQSWLKPETFQLLQAGQCALCVSDALSDSPPEIVVTAPFGYLRLRKPGYGDAELVSWRNRILAQEWESAYVFFKHESAAAGPEMSARFAGQG
jgi:uncharacterized protein YecE (DUF72 family)